MVKSRIRIFIYMVHLPDGVYEAVMPCADGYTVYIHEDLDEERKKKALIHALKHIQRNDWEKDDVQAIESEAHK